MTTLMQTDRTARIWNKMAERYAAKPIADEIAYAQKLSITREYLHPEASVLEFGCGTGSTALAHASYVGHIKATDVSSRMIDIARNKAVAAGVGNVEFACEAIDHVVTTDASIDVVMMHSLLHLLNDWRNSIALAHQVLKPGGVFVSSTMCLKKDFAWLRLIAPLGNVVGAIPPLSFFTQKELEQSMRDAGFEISHIWQPAPKAGVFMVARKSR